MPCRDDPAQEVVDAIRDTLLDVFNPAAECAPKVGGTTNVRAFAGEGAPLAAWDSHASQGGCSEPFVWVRAMRRYRSRSFPNPTIDTWPCDLPKVMAVEVGCGWCALIEQEPRWSDYANEAAISMDVAWRIEESLCVASSRLRRNDPERLIGTDSVVPYGPEGGVIAWTATLYATY